MFKDRKALVVHLWAHKGDSGGEESDGEEDEEGKKKEQYMTIIRQNKIRIKRGDFGVLPWFIENKEDEEDASAKGEIKTDVDGRPMQPCDNDVDDDDNDDVDGDDEREEEEEDNSADEGGREGGASSRSSTPFGADVNNKKKKKKYLTNLNDESTPGRSKRKASNVAKTSMKLVSRLSQSADGFDGVDHEESDQEGEGEEARRKEDGEKNGAGGSVAANGGDGKNKSKSRKNNISDFFNPGLFFADRLKFLCCTCKKKFEKDVDKAEHVRACHPEEGEQRVAYDRFEKTKNEEFLPEFSVTEIETFWKACQPCEDGGEGGGGFECGVCDEKAASEDLLRTHYYDNHIKFLFKKAWKPQRKIVQKYLKEARKEQQQQQSSPATKSPKPVKLPQQPSQQQQLQQQQTEEVKFRYIFACWPLNTENKDRIVPRTFLEMAGCSKCNLYFASRKDRKRHSRSTHADDPLPKFETLPRPAAAIDYKHADETALETLRNCSCLECGLFFCSSLFHKKHADKCFKGAVIEANGQQRPSLEKGLKGDLLAAFTPKQHLVCQECNDASFENEAKKTAHNSKIHGHKFNLEMSSDDESDSEGNQGPGFESILQLYGCIGGAKGGECASLFGSYTAVEQHRANHHDGKKMAFDPSTLDFDKLRYEEGAEALLETRSCVPCRIYFTKPDLKADHDNRFHNGENQGGRLVCDLKPAHSPGMI